MGPLALILIGMLSIDAATATVQNDVLRSLNDNEFYNYNMNYAYDLSKYSVVFEHCQDVKMYDDDLAADEDATSPLARRHFVVFRLCPTDTCSEECDSNFGRYATDVETFLTSTVNYQETDMEDMCQNCQEECDEYGESCSGCGKTCYDYENMENLGYLDAANYVECQEIQNENAEQNQGENDENQNDDQQWQQLFVGPACTSSGTIGIGLFSDENCMEPETNYELEDILGAPLSFTLLSHSLNKKKTSCLGCAENNGGDQNQNQNDANDVDDVNEMCEDLYDSAAKCESKTGIYNGFIQTAKEDNDYENQVETEFLSCGFIDQLIFNSYTEHGEINLKTSPYIISRVTTTTQIVALTMLSFSLAGLVFLIYRYNKRIQEVDPDHLMASPTTLGSYA